MHYMCLEQVIKLFLVEISVISIRLQFLNHTPKIISSPENELSVYALSLIANVANMFSSDYGTYIFKTLPNYCALK